MEAKTYWQQSGQLPRFGTISSDIDVDVAVVGAGLTGITAAHLLKKSGAKVALLERARCAAADTAHTTAHLTYVTDTRLHELVKTFGCDGAKAFWEAGMAAIDQIYDIVRTDSPDCEFQWIPGFLHAALGDPKEKERASLEEDARLAQAFGFNATFMDQVPYAG